MLWLTLSPTFPDDRSASSPETWAALACWAGRFTPRVTLPPAAQALSMEIAGSLRLFGGLPSLLQQMRSDLALQDLRFNLALASTPRAALWLARAGDGSVCTDRAGTLAALQVLPLDVLQPAPEVMLRLSSFGLHRLGDVMALPRAALATRLGQAFVLDLARALGEIDEPPRWFVFPDRFLHRIELPAPVEIAPVLLFVARRLIVTLTGWLAARNAATRKLIWRIEHGHDQLTELSLRFSAPVNSVARIERVLKERLERLVLPAAALSLTLLVEHVELREARSGSLFDGVSSGVSGGTEGNREALAELLDRFTARLGEGALQRLASHADHRPEYATRRLDAQAKTDNSLTLSAFPRPLWLLNKPQALRERNGRPQHRGELCLLAGPERIEAGWWDGNEKEGDVRRDYFIAIDAAQRWCWIFRQQGISAGWFIHGWFA
jgi:protein ImuB